MQIYLAPEGLEPLLEDELSGHIQQRYGRLFVTAGEIPSYWSQNIWFDVQTFKFASISEAARHLRSIQRNWWLHPVAFHRRAQLIQQQLPPFKRRELPFPTSLPTAPLGSWTLFDEHTLVYSARCSRLFPDGELRFQENKQDPPSRAYLKLWEFFTLVGRHPSAGQKVIDLGSSPGGWTWVLDNLGAEVISVDKAPLAPDLKLSNRVRMLSESAFGLKPTAIGPLDWLFSDIICYPERLLELIHLWEGHVRNMVCTIKFQGDAKHEIVREFLRLPGSQAMHLHHNKHELTWFRLKD